MARKSRKSKTRRTRKTRRYSTQNRRNTRFTPKASQNRLRFTPYKAIEYDLGLERTQPQKVRRVAPQVTEKPKKGIKKLTPPTTVVHTDNRKARICKRRHERKEIIHAIGKSGQGGQKRPNLKTRNIKC